MKAGYIIKHVGGSFFFYLILFFSAGRLDYWQGFVYLGIGLIMILLHYSILRPDSDLMSERAKPGEGVKKWDRLLLGLSLLITIALYITAGLDSGRFHWSPDFHWSLYLTGIILTITGQLLFLIAQKQNRFFSSTVRIQNDREHEVCETGLYKSIRHPAYLGSIIQLLGFPLIFGSLWVIIPAVLLIIIHVIRIYSEDETLKKELRGYSEYSKKTQYRIIPFVW